MNVNQPKRGKARNSSMLSQVSTQVTQDSHNPRSYKKGYYERRVDDLKGMKPKKWNKGTDWNDPTNICYWGKRTDDTIERFDEMTPPPRGHANRGNKHAVLKKYLNLKYIHINGLHLRISS
jgi:hypothetical protein